MSITVAIASDHAGYNLKTCIKDEFKAQDVGLEVDWVDLGTDSHDSVDYPDFGSAMARAIAQGRAMYGVLICGTGIGISIAANRAQQVRAAVCANTTQARLSRAHNDANVLALGARITGTEVALDCIAVFLGTEFEGGRHAGRVEKLSTSPVD
jgi:ribose 5-phosphate isomerase B